MPRYYIQSAPKVFFYSAGIIALFLLMAYMTRSIYRKYNPPAYNAARAAERKKALHDMRVAASNELFHAGILNSNKGIVRLPIERAMELTIEQWKNPVVGHSNLVALAIKANEPPPKQPEQPSP